MGFGQDGIVAYKVSHWDGKWGYDSLRTDTFASIKMHHPFSQAPAGTVFAIAISPGFWGFLRFFRGLSMGVQSIVGRSPQLPPGFDWNNQPISWVFFSFAPDDDKTEAIPLGLVAFESDEAAWAPPCFYPPDVIENCYRIHERGMVKKPCDQKDVAGMRECQRVTPAQLAAFLRARLSAGELKPI